MENMYEAVPKGTLVVDIAHIKQAIFPSTLESFSIFDMVRILWAGLRSIRIYPDAVYLNIDGIYLLDELKDEDKHRMIETGYSQTMRFFAKRFPKEGKNVLLSDRSVEVVNTVDSLELKSGVSVNLVK